MEYLKECREFYPPAGKTGMLQGVDRYRVERRPGALLTGILPWLYCVKAGDGTRELFVGSKTACERVCLELVCAFEDGKFVARCHKTATEIAKEFGRG